MYVRVKVVQFVEAKVRTVAATAAAAAATTAAAAAIAAAGPVILHAFKK